MCATYQAFGCAGLVTNGAGRDLDQVQKMGFPLFTSQTICSHGFSEEELRISVGGCGANFQSHRPRAKSLHHRNREVAEVCVCPECESLRCTPVSA